MTNPMNPNRELIDENGKTESEARMNKELENYIRLDGKWGWKDIAGNFIPLVSPRMGENLQALLEHAYQKGNDSLSVPTPNEGEIREKIAKKLAYIMQMVGDGTEPFNEDEIWQYVVFHKQETGYFNYADQILSLLKPEQVLSHQGEGR